VSDGTLELPCNERLWNARSAAEWQSLAAGVPVVVAFTIKEAVEHLCKTDSTPQDMALGWSWSPYACSVAMGAITIYVSQLSHGLHAFGELHDAAINGLGRSGALTAQLKTVVERCTTFLKQARYQNDDTYTWDETEGPLLFNALAMLRVSYCRVLTSPWTIKRMTLFQECVEEPLSAMSDFAMSPLEESDGLLEAVTMALDAIMIPSRLGSLLVRKTAAFTWAIEHAFAAWDSGKRMAHPPADDSRLRQS
jgi:hypothetical protein